MYSFLSFTAKANDVMNYETLEIAFLQNVSIILATTSCLYFKLIFKEQMDRFLAQNIMKSEFRST